MYEEVQPGSASGRNVLLILENLTLSAQSTKSQPLRSYPSTLSLMTVSDNTANKQNDASNSASIKNAHIGMLDLDTFDGCKICHGKVVPLDDDPEPYKRQMTHHEYPANN